MLLLLSLGVIFAVASSSSLVQQDNGMFPQHLHHQINSNLHHRLFQRTLVKRNSDHIITDCIHMISEEGQFYHRAAAGDNVGMTCGAYIFTEPDKKIELHFNYVDVPCENGGLISFVDGWEMNGEFFPGLHDHPKLLQNRFTEFCGQRKVRKIFSSNQNVALIQYRMGNTDSSFSFTVRFVPNPQPFNVLVQDTEQILTLRNYGKHSNCTMSALFPAAVRIASMNVGLAPGNGPIMEMETGRLHSCAKRGVEDYVQIGGSSGLDSRSLIFLDTICGLDSKPDRNEKLIGCGTSTVRLVSSGSYDNSITVIVRQLTEDDINGDFTVICPVEPDEKK